MKKIVRYTLAALLALAATVGANAADQLRVTDASRLAQWGPGPNAWFMQYAATNTSLASVTNDTTGPAYWGYTNTTLIPVNITAGSKVSLGVTVAFPHSYCTNTMTIRAWPSLDGVNKITQPGVGVLESVWSCTILGKGTTPVYWGTNAVVFNTNQVQVGASSAVNWPYLLVQVENPTNAASANVMASLMPTNLIIHATVKP